MSIGASVPRVHSGDSVVGTKLEHTDGKAAKVASAQYRKAIAASPKSFRFHVGFILAVAIAVLAMEVVVFGRRDTAFASPIAWIKEYFGDFNNSVVIEFVFCSWIAGDCFMRRRWRAKTKGKLGSSKATPPTPSKASVVPPPAEVAKATGAKRIGAFFAAVSRGDAATAAKLLHEHEQSGGQAAASHYNQLVRTYAKMDDLASCEYWVERMKAFGFEATLFTYHSLMDASSKAGAPDSCERWFARLVKDGLVPTVVSYAVVINVHAQQGNVVRAEHWLRRLLDSGIALDVVPFNSLIHAYSVRGDGIGAATWLVEMQKRGLKPDVKVFTAVVGAFAKARDIDGAEHWFEEMGVAGVEANRRSYCAAIDACAKSGSLERAEYWHGRMLEAGVQPSAHTYTTIISAVSKQSGSPLAICDLAESWLQKAFDAGVAPDSALYNCAIDTCGKAGDAKRALRLFQGMLDAGLPPQVIAYSAVARPFAHRGDWRKVDELAAHMAAHDVRPTEYFIYAQLLAYAVAHPRQVARAEKCFCLSLRQGIAVNDHTLGALVRAVGRERCAELLSEAGIRRRLPSAPVRGPVHSAT